MADPARILIVEDDSLIALDLKRVLAESDFTISGVMDTGEEVLEQIEKLAPDLVLMDINLKGKLDGIQTVEQLQHKLDVPVVFLTALNDEETLQRAKLTRPYGYLIKPFDPIELRSTIELTLFRFSEERREWAGKRPADHTEEEEPIVAEEAADRARFLGSIPAFVGASAQTIKLVAEASSIKSFEGGEFITLEEESTAVAFVPLSGRISITKTSEAGRDLIVALLAPSDIFGAFFVFDAFIGTASARAQIASKVLWIPVEALRQALQNDSAFSYAMGNALAARLARSHKLASSLAHARVEDRIINTLITLLPEFGKASGRGSHEGRIYITRKDLADLTGTTPETAIRVTKHLEREKLLDLSRPGIIKIPDVAGLEGWIGRER